MLLFLFFFLNKSFNAYRKWNQIFRNRFFFSFSNHKTGNEAGDGNIETCVLIFDINI